MFAVAYGKRSSVKCQVLVGRDPKLGCTNTLYCDYNIGTAGDLPVADLLICAAVEYGLRLSHVSEGEASRSLWYFES